jgi:3-oxoadipyl-CoA thiolase
MKAVYIIDALRTPIGKLGGVLSGVRPDDLAARTISALLERQPSVPVAEIEDVVLGCANQAGEDNRNIARMALLLAGLPVEVPGVTVNRLCASGLQAVMDAATRIAAGQGDIFIAGGVESMSRAPYVMPKPEMAFQRSLQLTDTTLGWRFVNPALAELYTPYSMGETAENVAERYGVSRQAQDNFALQSHRKYVAAQAQGKFDRERISVPLPSADGTPRFVGNDEAPRPDTSLEKMARLKPVFREHGTVTAGNASGLNDGAAALLLASEDAVRRYDLQPLARVVSMAVAGVHPDVMGTGPIPATQKALQRAGLRIGDIGLAEINEAYAVQVLVCMNELQLDEKIVNVNGGAIAIGHPLGCSGARISATLLHEMARTPSVRYGLATMCVGVGQGAAIIYEKP